MKKHWMLFLLVVSFSLAACENLQRKLSEDVNSRIEEQLKKVDTLVNEQVDRVDTLVNKHVEEQLNKVDSLINKLKN